MIESARAGASKPQNDKHISAAAPAALWRRVIGNLLRPADIGGVPRRRDRGGRSAALVSAPPLQSTKPSASREGRVECHYRSCAVGEIDRITRSSPWSYCERHPWDAYAEALIAAYRSKNPLAGNSATGVTFHWQQVPLPGDVTKRRGGIHPIRVRSGAGVRRPDEAGRNRNRSALACRGGTRARSETPRRRRRCRAARSSAQSPPHRDR